MRRSSYGERDYSFGQMMLTLRTTIGLTQTGLASQLGVSRNAVAQWEGGSSYPKAEHLQHVIELGVQAFAFPAQHEEEAIQTLWRAARQKVLLDEHWLRELLRPSSASSTEQSAVGATQRNLTTTDGTAIWMVPFPRNAHFTGRHELLDQLTVQLTSRASSQPTTLRRAALTQAQVIKGLGGIGKTQIAVEYAYRAREMGHYIHTFWIFAASEETLLMSFAVLAEHLPSVSCKEETDQRKLVSAVIRCLEQCQEPWLLLVDNADDLQLIQPYLPLKGNGSILLTTRASATNWLASSLEVGVMGLMEGTELLLRRAQRFTQAVEEEINEATNLVIELAQFPLALDQAGAYIEETGCNVGDYLQLYQTHRHDLLSRRGQQTGQYPASVATTWSLSFAHIAQTDPAAAELLRLCAFFAPDHIPEELLTEGAPYWPPVLQEAVTDRFRFNQILETLLAFSLVKRLVEARQFSIHRLVQVVQQERLSPEERRQWAERLVLATNAVFPREPEEVASWPLCQRYLEQVQTCDTLLQQHQLLLPEAAEVLDRAGSYLRECALYALAEPLYQHAIRIEEQQGEPKDLSVASTLHGLAKLYRGQGKYTEAESLYQQALLMREQQVGPEHPLVATSLNDLAGLYRSQGKYTLAEPLLQRALSIRERYFGSRNLQAADSLNDLAVLYENQRKYAEAEPLSQLALSIREQHLEPDHPLVATSLNNLAVLYGNQGAYAKAESLYLRALRIWEQQLGETHLQVASPLLGLASTYRGQGAYAKAEPLYLRALSIREQHLGADHDTLAFPLNGLAEIYRTQGKFPDAESLYLRALSIREQRLGPEHRLVAFTLDGLAHLYSMQDKFPDAESLYLRALRIREQWGPEYRDLALSLRGLANLYTQHGKYTKAEPLYVRALHICEQQIGPEHLETAKVLDDFAGFQQVQGNTLEAAVLYQRALTIRENMIGADHVFTIGTCERLHAVLLALGQTGYVAKTLGET